METFTLSLTQPFSQKMISVEWVSVATPTGTFIIGPGHEPIVSLISPGESVVYKASGIEHEVEVAPGGGIVHIMGGDVRLILG